jgi:hypothetical protein
MTKTVETVPADMSRNISRDAVDEAIFKVLSSSPKKAGELQTEVVRSTELSPAKYYERLRFLRERREVISVPQGRNKYYGLPKDKDRLIQFQKKGGDLQRRIIDSALYLADYMMKDARYDASAASRYLNASINLKFDMLLDMLVMLRRTDPGLPVFHCEEDDKPLKDRDDARIVRAEYRYLLTVLEYFKAL